MAEDIYVNTDGEMVYDAFGDYETVVGEDNVRQQIRLAVTQGVDVDTVTQLTQQQKRQWRRDIRTSLDSCPYVDDIVTITLDSPTDEKLLVTVETRSDDIPLEFST
jgi:hypothetical protein